jgi:hypothetical protein
MILNLLNTTLSKGCNFLVEERDFMILNLQL